MTEIDYVDYYKSKKMSKEEYEKERNKLMIDRTLSKIYNPEEIKEVERKLEALEKAYPEYSNRYESKDNTYTIKKSAIQAAEEILNEFGISYKIDRSKVRYESLGNTAGKREKDGSIVIDYSHKDDVATHIHEAYHDYMAKEHNMYKDLRDLGIEGSITEASAHLLELYVRLKQVDKEVSKKTPEEFGISFWYLIYDLMYNPEFKIKSKPPTMNEVLQYIKEKGVKIFENDKLLKSVISNSVYSSWGWGRSATVADIVAEKFIKRFREYKEKTNSIEEAIKAVISPQVVKEIAEEVRKELGKYRKS